MSVSLTIKLDPFGNEVLGQYAERSGSTAGEVIRLALQYYLSDAAREPVGWRVPTFLNQTDLAQESVRLRIDLDDETRRALAREAARQDVPVERIVEHALLYFLAHLDGGHLARRLAESLSGGETSEGPRE